MATSPLREVIENSRGGRQGGVGAFLKQNWNSRGVVSGGDTSILPSIDLLQP